MNKEPKNRSEAVEQLESMLNESDAPFFLKELLMLKVKEMARHRGFEALSEGVQTPQRATSKSAGYDIRANEEVFILPGEMKAIKTGLTAYMQDDEFVDLRIRSGLAFKYQLTLQNDAGVIDADYYGKEIAVMIRNEGKEVARFVAGDRIAQAIFTHYLTTDDDTPSDTERAGGFGSTGVK